MADYSDCIRKMRELARLLDSVVRKSGDQRTDLREVVDYLEAAMIRLGNENP